MEIAHLVVRRLFCLPPSSAHGLADPPDVLTGLVVVAASSGAVQERQRRKRRVAAQHVPLRT